MEIITPWMDGEMHGNKIEFQDDGSRKESTYVNGNFVKMIHYNRDGSIREEKDMNADWYEGTRPGAEEAHEAPAGEIPAEEAHEAPAGEVPASTETPVAPDEIEPDADDLVPHDVEIPKKQKIHQVGPVDANFQLIWVEPGTI